MKKLFLLLLPALVLGACKPIDPVVEEETYQNVVVYSHDIYSDTGIATDYASITVKSDYSSGYFMLDLNDFKLAKDQPLRSSTIYGLTQLIADETDPVTNAVSYKYVHFKSEGMTSYSGDLQVMDLKFGWLSSIYWGSFVGDGAQYKVWMLPRQVSTYANNNTVINVRGDSIIEKAIHPRLDFELDVANSTVTLSASYITLPYSASEGKQFNIRNMVWPSLPVVYTANGFTILHSEPFFAQTAQGNNLYEISNLECSFDADYDGKRTLSYMLRRVTDNEAIRVTSHLDYFLASNY